MLKITNIINENMIGVCGDKTCCIEGSDLMQIKVIPAIPLRDFYNKHLEGIRGMNIGKHFDYINTFQIASTKMTKTDRLILKELEIGDVFTFDISINILSSIDSNEGSNTCREIPDIKNCLYSNLRKYRDNDCIDRIVTTALQNADRYSFNYNAPRTFKELKALVNKMSEDNLSEATADMYTQWQYVCLDNDFTNFDFDNYFYYNQDLVERDNALFELSALGYFKHNPIPLNLDLPKYFKNVIDKTHYLDFDRKCLF